MQDSISTLSILYDICFMSGLLFIAKIIRSKVRFIQKLYIPSALIAGFLGLFLGKQFLNIIPFSSEISNYSGILIAFIFGSMFLGNKEKTSFKHMFSTVGDTFLVNAASEMSQFGVFMLIGITILPLVFKGINPGFGLMLPSGFVGGHGTAAAIGSVFAESGWKDATSIGQTFATIGLLFGILGGVVIINIGARKHQTAVIKSVKDLPNEMLTGLVPKDKRTSFGENTVNAMSIDTLTWHMLLLFVSVGLAYLINAGLKLVFPNISFPVYGLALICSIFVQAFLRLIKLDDNVDKQIITHLGSSATDYLVAFGVASINVSVIVRYWIPIVILSILGALFVLFWFYIISPRFFRTFWFERGIYIFGLSTGVMATGVILLRICDPEFKTGVLEDFGFAWIFLSIMDMLVVSLAPALLLAGHGVEFCLVLICLSVLCLCLCKTIFRNKKPIYKK